MSKKNITKELNPLENKPIGRTASPIPTVKKKKRRTQLKKSKKGHICGINLDDLPADDPKHRRKKKEKIDLQKIARDVLSSKRIYLEIDIGTEQHILNLKSPKTIYGALLAVLVEKGLSGNVVAAKEVIDRGVGRPAQVVEVPEKIIDEEKPEELDEDDLKKIILRGESG